MEQFQNIYGKNIRHFVCFGMWIIINGLRSTLPRKILGVPGEGVVDFINVKCDKETIDFFHGVNGILPAYHMNKQNWITVLLDGTVPEKNVKKLISMSFDLTK